MAMSVSDVLRWLKTLDPDDEVAVDEGGLELVSMKDPHAYLEVGGISDDPDEEEEDDEDEAPAVEYTNPDPDEEEDDEPEEETRESEEYREATRLAFEREGTYQGAGVALKDLTDAGISADRALVMLNID